MSSIDVRAIDVKKLRKVAAPTAKHEFRVFLSEEAFDRAVERGDNDVSREVGGILIGEVLHDDAGPYLKIETTIDALHAEEKGAELTITHATWDHIHKEKDAKHPDKLIVGWYHTHPGHGIFLSDRDLFIHKNFFSEPFQVAVVYDPKSREHGVFIWHDNELWRARRYWIGSREQVWDGQRGPSIAEKDKADKAKADKAKAGRSESSGADGGGSDDKVAARDEGLPGSLASLILLGVVLLIIGGFAGHWLGTGQVSQVQSQAQAEIAVAKSAGAVEVMSLMQTQLVDVLSATLSDEAIERPVAMAVNALNQAIDKLPQPPPPPPAPAAEAAGSGSAAGSAAPPAGQAGSAAPPPAPLAPAAPPAPAKPVSPTDAMLQDLAVQLRGIRDQLLVAKQRRANAELVLQSIELAARSTNQLRTNFAHDLQDLAHDVAGHRSGLGALYAELATDAVKQNDLDRARRLLAAAAHLDPGNRVRYEKQLQSFDKTASLPRESEATDAAGATGSQQGSKR